MVSAPLVAGQQPVMWGGGGRGEGWSRGSARRPCNRTLRFLPDAAAPEGSLTSRSRAETQSMASSEQPVESEPLEVGVGPPAGVLGGGSGGGSVSARPFRLFLRRRARHRALACLAVIRWPCAPRRAATVAQRDPQALRVRILPRACAVACHNSRSRSALHLGAQGGLLALLQAAGEALKPKSLYARAK